MHNLQSRWKTTWLFLITSITSIYFIFSPAVLIPFHHHDSYKNSLGNSSELCEHDGGGYFNHTLSRHIAALTECANYKYATTLTRMSIARLIDVLIIGISMALFALWISRLGFSFWSSLFIGGSLFVLPCLQTSLIMAAHQLPLAILFAFLGCLSIHKSYQFYQRRNESHVIAYSILGIALLMLSLFTYTPISSFFLVPALVLLLFKPLNEWVHTRKIILFDILIFAVCSGIFLLIAKHHTKVLNYTPVAGYHYDLNLNIINRLMPLLSHFAYQANLYHCLIQTSIIAIIMIGGVFISLYQTHSHPRCKSPSSPQNRHPRESGDLQKDPRFRGDDGSAGMTGSCGGFAGMTQAIIAVILLFLLGSAVFLLSPEPTLQTRIVHTFYAMSVLLVIWALFKWASIAEPSKRKSLFTVLVGILFIVNAVYANYNITKSALNDNFEMNYLITQIKDYVQHHQTLPKRIHVIAPNKASFNGRESVDDIFNLNSTLFSGDIDNMLYTALTQLVDKSQLKYTDCVVSNDDTPAVLKQRKQCINSAPKDHIIFSYGRSAKTIYQTPEMLVIDMNSL